MIKLVIDAMSGDNGSKVVVEAIKQFKKDYSDVSFIVCGKKEELEEIKDIVEIIDAPDIVPMDAGPLQVLRMKNSSMMRAIKEVKENGYDAVVSCGSTGGFLSASTITLKMIPGIKRAALCTCFPTMDKNKKLTLLDVGANNENSGEELYQFAIMGRLYSQVVYGVKDPATYLLCNGSEDEKGSPTTKEAHKLLTERNFPNFGGNVEARDVFDGHVDVMVCDGFSGNVFLKGCEGTAKFVGGLVKSAFKRNLWSKLGYLHVRKGMKEMSQTLDYKAVGGALLLGINGIAIKGHGNSDAYAFYHAIRVAYQLASQNIVEKIKKELENQQEMIKE